MKPILALLILCLTSFFAGQQVRAAGANLPYFNDFESYSIDTELPLDSGVWSRSNETVYVRDYANIQGSKGIAVSNMLSLNIENSAAYSNVLIQVYCKPVLAETAPSINSSIACAFYVNVNGSLIAYSNSQWVTLVSDFPTNNWVGFAIHADYKSKRWDLYYTADGYNTSLKKANNAPLKMNAIYSGSYIKGLKINSSSYAYFDSIVGQRYADPIPNQKTNVIAHTQTLTAGEETLLGYIGNAFGPNDNTLANSRLAVYLESLLQNGDKIRVFLVDYGLAEYEMSGGVLQKLSGPDPEDVHVTPGMAVKIVPVASRTLYALALPDHVNYTPTVIAKKTSPSAGFTRLAWQIYQNNSTVNDPGGNRWGFLGIAKGGDTIYMKDKNSGNFYSLVWDSNNNVWRNNKTGQVADGITMTPGQDFYYLRPFSDVEGSWTNQIAK